MLSFKQHSVFFLVEQYPLQFFDKLLSTSTINSNNQTVTEKFEQCCKVTDNTVMVVIFTVDVNTKSYKRNTMYLLKRDHVCRRMKFSRLQYRHRVFYGLEFLNGVMDWSIGVETWVELTGAIFFPRPLPGFSGISNFIFKFVKKETDKAMFSSSTSLFSLIN